MLVLIESVLHRLQSDFGELLTLANSFYTFSAINKAVFMSQ